MIDYARLLNPAQLEATQSLDGPVLVVAGAGSGKTRTLIFRLARLVESGIPPEQVLLLTFTRKAAEEMLHRAGELSEVSCKRVTGGTFHALAHQWLRRLAPRIGYPRQFHILDRPDTEAVLTSLKAEMKVKSKTFPKNRTVGELFSRTVNRQIPLEELLSSDYPHLLQWIDELVSLREAYRAYKQEAGLMDFDDLLVIMARVMEEDDGVRAEVASRYSHIMVDEYQDTNPIQARLVRLLARDHDRVMAVGDDSQSIYSFRGADLQNMLDFPKMFPGAKVIKLETNYRSVQPILDTANAVIAPARRSFTKCLQAHRGGGPAPVFFEAKDEGDQSRFIIDQIRALRSEGLDCEEMAVLFRAGFHSFDLEVQLAKAGIGFVKYGGFKFVEAAHVKDVLSFLRARLNPKDTLSLARCLMLLPGVGPKKSKDIIDWLRESGSTLAQVDQFPGKTKANQEPLSEVAALMSSLEAAEMRGPAAEADLVMEFYRPYLVQRFDDHPRRAKDLETVTDLALNYNSTYRFLSDLALDPPSNLYSGREYGEKLVLSTVHSAKGLEWKAVFILWATEGRFPAGPALEDEEALEEERRMMYVAITRAQDHLYICSPVRSYSLHQGTIFHTRSRFLDEARAQLNPFKPRQPRPRHHPEPQPQAERPLVEPPQGGYSVGQPVEHPAFGQGRVAGYLGEKQIVILFPDYGHKTLHLDYAPLSPVGD